MSAKTEFLKGQLARLAAFGETVLEKTEAEAAKIPAPETYAFQVGAYKAAVYHMTDQLKAFAKIIK